MEISQFDAVEVRFSLDKRRNYADLCAIRKLSHEPTHGGVLVSRGSSDRKQVLEQCHTGVDGMREGVMGWICVHVEGRVRLSSP